LVITLRGITNAQMNVICFIQSEEVEALVVNNQELNQHVAGVEK